MINKKLSSLSVFFPCYNEEKNIRPSVKKFQDLLPNIAEKYEIIIVDDGSHDKTGAIADELAQKDPHVRVVHHAENQGYGASLRSGYTAARYTWTFFTDGDLQFDINELKNFVAYTSDYNVVIGYRIKRAEGKLRAFNAHLFKMYVDLLFRLHVRDIDCAFKLIKTSSVRAVTLESTGAFINAELLYKLKKKGEEFKQLPVHHLLRKFGKPTGNNPRIVIKAGLEALQLYLHMKFGW